LIKDVFRPGQEALAALRISFPQEAIDDVWLQTIDLNENDAPGLSERSDMPKQNEGEKRRGDTETRRRGETGLIPASPRPRVPVAFLIDSH